MLGKGKTVFGGLHKIAYSWAISCMDDVHVWNRTSLRLSHMLEAIFGVMCIFAPLHRKKM